MTRDSIQKEKLPRQARRDDDVGPMYVSRLSSPSRSSVSPPPCHRLRHV